MLPELSVCTEHQGVRYRSGISVCRQCYVQVMQLSVCISAAFDQFETFSILMTVVINLSTGVQELA